MNLEDRVRHPQTGSVSANPEARQRVLIASADATTRMTIVADLEQQGFLVFDVDNGAGGSLAFAEHAPQIVFLDCSIGGQDAFSTCAQIRRLPGGQAVPIVLLTSVDDLASVDKAYAAGATDVISAPIDWPVFTHRVRYILRASSHYQKLRLGEAKNDALLTAVPDSLIVLAPDSEIVEYLPGNTQHPLPDPGKRSINLANYLPRRVSCVWEYSKQAVIRTGQAQRIEFTLGQGRAETCYYEARFLPYVDGQILVAVSEITDRKTAERKIHQLAYYDTLTGLPNRQFFRHRLERMIEVARASEVEIAVLYIDLDNFKRINDTLGHTFGDGVLKAIADRLAGCLRNQLSESSEQDGSLGIARLGGDEFVAAIEGIDDEKTLSGIADRICEQLRQPVSYLGQEFVVTPSIGISIFPHDGDNVEDLLKNADVAMYQAKGAGRNSVRFYSGTMSVRSLQRLELEADLRQALRNEDLELHYQPKLDIASGELAGVEALIRWRHPDGGYIPPGSFIPLAEESGLITPLGEWVLQTACRQAHAWQDRYRCDLRVAVNISSQQFYQSDIRKTVMRALFEASAKPSLLQLELTESILMRDVDETIATLDYLKNSGVTLAIDDFGTGYSSLSYLKRFPLDALKIDRSFVKDLPENNDDAAICGAIIAMAHQLGLMVIAEGVETKEQLEFLRMQNCDQVQGFLFAKPMPAKEFETGFLLKSSLSSNADFAG